MKEVEQQEEDGNVDQLMWTYIWSKTTVDDIIMAKAEEVKSKAKEIKKIIKK